jgi:DNA-binding transcriptional LysR family regulator
MSLRCYAQLFLASDVSCNVASSAVSIESIDLNLLVSLNAVLAERSVARAAKRLHVTPSAVSNALARLRDLLGDPLLVRSGRGIVPTPKALELAPVLARALRDLDSVVHAPDFQPSTTKRQFSLAVADAGQVSWLPRLAALMAERMPQARLRVVGIDSLVSLGGLGGTEVDVLVGAGEHEPGIHRADLYQDQPVLVGRKSHPAARRSISRAALARLRHVAVSMVPRAEFRDLTSIAYEKAKIPRNIAVTVPGFTAAAAIAAATDLVATIPRTMLEVVGPTLELVRIVAPTPAGALRIRMLWHQRTHADPAMMEFRNLVAAAWPGGKQRS